MILAPSYHVVDAESIPFWLENPFVSVYMGACQFPKGDEPKNNRGMVAPVSIGHAIFMPSM